MFTFALEPERHLKEISFLFSFPLCFPSLPVASELMAELGSCSGLGTFDFCVFKNQLLGIILLKRKDVPLA